MNANYQQNSFKNFKLFKNIDEKFLTKSYNNTKQQALFQSFKGRLRNQDLCFRNKMQTWKDLEEKEILFDEINDLIHREYDICQQQNKGYFQQLFNKEKPLPTKKVSSIQFKDQFIILHYSVDQDIQHLNLQQDFEKMMYKTDKQTFISQIDEEEGNVKIDYKVTNWIENYFYEGRYETVMPQVYKDIYFYLAVSLAFFYKFVKNALD
ncbi:hypothetical protein ABPG74_002929 [Tetrahymena malaccensis]